MSSPILGETPRKRSSMTTYLNQDELLQRKVVIEGEITKAMSGIQEKQQEVLQLNRYLADLKSRQIQKAVEEFKISTSGLPEDEGMRMRQACAQELLRLAREMDPKVLQREEICETPRPGRRTGLCGSRERLFSTGARERTFHLPGYCDRRGSYCEMWQLEDLKAVKSTQYAL